ncbi:unnamed protein product [Prorocentrum cordatum]|uniref:Uncharacterized protein n=1 Tax=Prorocentrum cordatum TaxID=2364126 RepID=A0ABN9UWR8_9DINO|nr:unnamed protein product [Polarella glacialis]
MARRRSSAQEPRWSSTDAAAKAPWRVRRPATHPLRLRSVVAEAVSAAVSAAVGAVLEDRAKVAAAPKVPVPSQAWSVARPKPSPAPLMALCDVPPGPPPGQWGRSPSPLRTMTAAAAPQSSGGLRAVLAEVPRHRSPSAQWASSSLSRKARKEKKKEKKDKKEKRSKVGSSRSRSRPRRLRSTPREPRESPLEWRGAAPTAGWQPAVA